MKFSEMADSKKALLLEFIKGEKNSGPAVDPVPLFSLFRFADFWDKIFMILGSISAIAVGICIPLLVLVFGDIIDAFADDAREQAFKEYFLSESSGKCGETSDSNEEFKRNLVYLMSRFSLQYVYIGIGVIFSCWAQITFWVLAAERQCHKMRIAFFRSVLYQTVGWFDQKQAGELNIRLTDDITKIQTGIGDKIGISLQWLATGIASFALGIHQGWQLSLVILAFCPLIGIGALTMSKFVASLSNTESAAYSKAGCIADEVLSNIRTVVAYGGEKKEAVRYGDNLHAALKAGVKKSAIAGLGMGFTYLVVFSAYCLGFWYGAKLVRYSEQICRGQCEEALFNDWGNKTTICRCPDAVYTPGVLVTVFFSIIFGAFGFGQLFPNFTSLSVSRSLARTIFDIVDQKSDIDASKGFGVQIPTNESFDIKFTGVKFAYPNRFDVEVLRGLDLDIRNGETLALVGKSGCGKSTIVQLVQRFYDPIEGSVTVGSHELQSLNVKWLREQIGVVSQEPILFATTIAENIRYGRLDVTLDEIKRAAKYANAHDFIKKLPHQYDTLVGDRGAQLSGGQKQRIAIARALVRNPKILLLDEATSALDTESEAVVQEALDKACQGRTTVVVAHRLSTIQNADRIAVIKDGKVVEIGNHSSLMLSEGLYHRMVVAQRLGEDLEPDSNENYVPAQRLTSKVSVVSKKSVTEMVIEEKKLPQVSLARVFKMNSPEWFFILFGCLVAIGNGAIQPLFAIIFAEFMNVFSIIDLAEQESKSLYYSFGFLLIGVLIFSANFLQSLMFGISGERLTKRLRRLSFQAMLRQEIGWFDEPENSTGSLTTRLATETSSVNGATGVRLGVFMQAVGSMGIGLFLAFIHGWKMSLVILVFVPFIVIGGAAQMKLMVGFSAQATQGAICGGRTACEALDNIRTVISLGRENEFLQSFINEMAPGHRKELKNAIIYGLAYGFSQGVVYFTYAASLYYGATRIQLCEMTFVQVLKVFGCICFSAMAVGQASSFAPDYGKAKAAANEIFALLDRTPLVDYSSDAGIQLDNIKGSVAFVDVSFRYPSRPDVEVLQNLTFTVPPGKTLALVGSSGCGKSTCVQLLERFYDVANGKVLLESVDVKSLSVAWLRSQFGLVSQEPALFDRTIAENIAYGDNSRDVTIEEVIEAARSANIHEFIASLPRGYETRVGERGAQLSGGQKQRIAIARALIRSPKVLLLDEATSALDSESEHVVQEALDSARENRTCIVIAHRLSTVQNADAIAVISSGRVAEYGTHSDLMARQGLYYHLNKAQSRF